MPCIGNLAGLQSALCVELCTMDLGHPRRHSATISADLVTTNVHCICMAHAQSQRLTVWRCDTESALSQFKNLVGVREKQVCVGSILTSRVVCDLTHVIYGYICRSAGHYSLSNPTGAQFPAPTLVLANQLAKVLSLRYGAKPGRHK